MNNPVIIIFLCILGMQVIYHIERIQHKKKMAKVAEELEGLQKIVDDLILSLQSQKTKL